MSQNPDVASPTPPALVLFAHGARDPEWAAPLRAIQSRVRAREPGRIVELAFLEFMQPGLEATVDRLAADGHHAITVAPIFIAQGGHLKHDLPILLANLRQRHPRLALTLLPALGDSPQILDAVSDWLVNTAA